MTGTSFDPNQERTRSARTIAAAAATLAAERVAALARARSAQAADPVFSASVFFCAIRQLGGEVGAPRIIETSGVPVVDFDVGDGTHLDVDEQESVLAAGRILKG
jgi:molybdenum cofactor cytidylyltransferase